jgi:hypothetical protein
MPNSHNPNSLFTQTKDWIGRGQAEVIRQHDVRAESGQTPLSLLVEDVKQDPQKHIQRLKRVMATAAVLATGMCSFNPNAMAQSQRPTQVERNTTQAQSNSEKEAVKTAETKVIKQFVNQVFNPQSEYSTMQNGGTLKAIQHALENGGTITVQNAPQIIMEAIKTNNGNTNPINLKHYKTQIKIFMINIELGYTPSEALIRSTEECAKQNPSEIKAPRIDLERLSIVAQDIRGNCIDAKVDATVGLSDTAKTQAKIDLRKAKYTTPAEESKAWLRLMNESKTPIVAPSIYSTPEAKDDIKDKAQKPKIRKPVDSKTSAPSPSTPLNTSGQFGPFNNPKNPSVPPEAKVESTPDKGFEWFQTLNRKAIEDTLKQLGIILTVGGVATVAGIKGSKALYKKYQAWESNLPIISEDEARRIFWENINKIKSDYRKKKNFDAKLKLSKINQTLRDKEQLSTTEIGEGDMQEFDQVFGNIPDNTNSTDVKQINTNLRENTLISTAELNTQSTSQPIELKPKLGERWSSFIAGFRQKFNNLKTKITHPFQAQVENKKLYDQTKAREQGVISDMAKFAEKKENKKQAHFSKLVFNIRSLYSNLLLVTQPQYELGSKALIEEDRKTKESRNDTRQKAENKLKMDNFEIPFVPENNGESAGEVLELPEDVNMYSNFDLEALLLITNDRYNKKAIENSPYYIQAIKAKTFLNRAIDVKGYSKVIKQLKKLLPNKSEKMIESFAKIESNLSPMSKKIKLKTEYGTIEYYEESYNNAIDVLDNLKQLFHNDLQLKNALETIINHYKEVEKSLVLPNKIKKEIALRPNKPKIVNKDGEFKEGKKSYLKYLLKLITALDENVKLPGLKRANPIFYSELKHINDQILSIISNSCDLVTNPITPLFNFEQINLNKFNFDSLNIKLGELLNLVLKYKLPVQTIRHSTSDYTATKFMVENNLTGYSDSFGGTAINIDVIFDLLEKNDYIKYIQLLPPNYVTHIENEYEEEILPFYSGYWYFHGEKVQDRTQPVKFRTSKKFPNVLERYDEKLYIRKLCNKQGNLDLSAAERAYRNPQTATPDEHQQLIWINELINNPKWSYRPNRKQTQASIQKPITIEELFLAESI